MESIIKNKRGQSFGIILISIIFFWIIAFACVNFVMDLTAVTTAQLDCDNAAGISDGTMFLCLFTDTTVIYLIITIISVIMGAVTAQLLMR